MLSRPQESPHLWVAPRAGAASRLFARAHEIDRLRGAAWGTTAREAALAASLRSQRVVRALDEMPAEQLDGVAQWLDEELEAARPRTVLVIEDEDATRHLIVGTLARAGWRAIAAVSAEDALALLARTEIDVIVSDHGLPGMSGLDLLRRLRAEGTSIPFVVVSGSDPSELGDGLTFGVAAFVPKPFSLDMLRRAVAAAAGSPP